MRNILLFCTVAALTCSGAYAADVKVQWLDAEKFSDIRPANESRKMYRERVLKKFDEFFHELAAKLPEGYSWELTVTDIDLAGEVDYFIGGAGNALRVVKDIYSPAIKFNHVLRDKYGEEIVSAEESLRDMGFLQSLRSVTANDELHYEQQMLQDWFEKELQPIVEQYGKTPPKVSGG